MIRSWSLLCALLFSLSASAATFTVTSSAGSGAGTLRQAILDANAAPGLDQIRFAVTNVTLTNFGPPITGPVDIDGTVGTGRVVITGVLVDGSTIIDFQPGSSGSSARNMIFRNAYYFVRTNGVTDISIASNLGNSGFLGSIYVSRSSRVSVTDNFINFFELTVIMSSEVTVLRNTASAMRVILSSAVTVGSNGNGNRFGQVEIVSSAATIAFNTVDTADTITTFGGIDVHFLSSTPPPALSIVKNIVRNAPKGIRIEDSNTGVLLSQNLLTGNGIGIDLDSDGPTPNDPAPDADSGANNRQNYPVLAAAQLIGGSLTAAGTLTSAPLTPYVLEFFSSSAADPEARTYLGTTNVTTDATGNAAFNATLATTGAAAGDVVTATARNAVTNDTSELSAPLAVIAPGTLSLAQSAYTVNEVDGTVAVTVLRSGGSDGTVTVAYTTANGSATAPEDYVTTSGTLVFGPGVTSQTVNVPIAPGGAVEPDETFTFTLSNPTNGAQLGAPSQAVVTIVDAAMIPALSTWMLIALFAALAAVTLMRLR
ncbi:MAG TPA: Calx-beta domain-containing protein [Thermoanaerobaculia bacterium]|jgi:hypothetical protein